MHTPHVHLDTPIDLTGAEVTLDPTNLALDATLQSAAQAQPQRTKASPVMPAKVALVPPTTAKSAIELVAQYRKLEDPDEIASF